MKKPVFILACSLLLFLSVVLAYAAEEKWQGVDETVVGKYAKEHGRPAKPGIIDLEGDALLFAFLIAGVAGGFTLGYYYRDFMGKKGGEGKINEG